MKRIFILFFAVLAMSQLCNAQTPANNPTVHVKVNGSNTGLGTLPFFLDAITIDQFLINLYDSLYSGDITVYLAGGDYYYASLKFWGVPRSVQSISLYGGFDPTNYSAYGNFPSRDLVTNETRLHAKDEIVIWYEAVGYHHVNGWKTCRVDGITITSDGSPVDFAALRLVGGDHIISQCKIENFNTSSLLIWLETGGNHVTFTSCLFDNNEAGWLMGLASHVDIINTTIADNDLDYDMFVHYYTYDYNLRNSIIYGNSNMSMGVGSFDVSNSILSSYEGWVNDMGNNYFGTDPEFTYNTLHPYTCNTSTSPAIGGGNSMFILLNSYYESDIMNYDVINASRYGSNPLIVDIGAYQHTPAANRQKGRNSNTANSSIRLWANANTIYVSDLDEQGATLSLYNAAGQIVYSTPLQADNNTIPLVLNADTYIARVTDKEGKEIVSSKIVI